jgi:hypothetical protein
LLLPPDKSCRVLAKTHARVKRAAAFAASFQMLEQNPFDTSRRFFERRVSAKQGVEPFPHLKTSYRINRLETGFLKDNRPVLFLFNRLHFRPPFFLHAGKLPPFDAAG